MKKSNVPLAEPTSVTPLSKAEAVRFLVVSTVAVTVLVRVSTEAKCTFMTIS